MKRSASSAAAQPVPEAVIAWRYVWSTRSPAANTPGTLVRVLGRVDLDVALVVHLDLALEQLAARVVADRDEHAGHVEDLRLAGLAGCAAGRRRPCRPRRGSPRPTLFHSTLIFVVGQRAGGHDLAGPERVAPVHDRHRLGEAGEEGRLLHRRVAAADHDDVLVAEEEAVTGGTRRHAVAEQLLLAGHAQRAPGGTGGEDDGAGEVLGLADVHRLEALGARLGGRRSSSTRVTSSVMNSAPKRSACLRIDVHQLGAHDAVGEAREVLHLGGGHQRATGLHALDHERLEVGPGRVERRGVAGRPRADDDQVSDLVHCRLPLSVIPGRTGSCAHQNAIVRSCHSRGHARVGQVTPGSGSRTAREQTGHRASAVPLSLPVPDSGCRRRRRARRSPGRSPRPRCRRRR